MCVVEEKPFHFREICVNFIDYHRISNLAMLQVGKLSGFLNQSCTNGITAAFLMTTSGALLGAGGGQNTIDEVTENVQAAISANVWESFARMPTNYETGETRKGASENETLNCLVLELEASTIALQSFGEYVVCLCSEKNTNEIKLRARLDALSTALSAAFDRLA